MARREEERPQQGAEKAPPLSTWSITSRTASAGQQRPPVGREKKGTESGTPMGFACPTRS